jgi:hypothetical protein
MTLSHYSLRLDYYTQAIIPNNIVLKGLKVPSLVTLTEALWVAILVVIILAIYQRRLNSVTNTWRTFGERHKMITLSSRQPAIKGKYRGRFILLNMLWLGVLNGSNGFTPRFAYRLIIP